MNTAGDQAAMPQSGSTLSIRTSIWSAERQMWEAIETEPMDGPEWQLFDTISAEQMGCEPGTLVLIEVVDEAGEVLDSIKAEAVSATSPDELAARLRDQSD